MGLERVAAEGVPATGTAQERGVEREDRDRVSSLGRAIGNESVQSFIAGRTRPRPTAGHALDKSTRDEMEVLLGRPFGDVRIHTDSGAAALAGDLSAEAFTVGRDVFFAAGRYAPQTEAGRRLVSHELVHVAQQTSGALAGLDGTLVPPDHRTEAAASRGEIDAAGSGQETQAIQRQPVGAAEPTSSVQVTFDQERPWLYSVDGSLAEASIALYGGDVTAITPVRQIGVDDPEAQQTRVENRYVVIPEALRSPYREQFRSAMSSLLDADIARVEDILLQVRIDGDDESRLMATVRRWVEAKDLRTETGASYFDAFLGRLQRDTWHTDYLLWNSDSHPFLDKLYLEVEERAGELNTLIAENSVEFGAYRPTWTLFDPSGAIRAPAQTAGTDDLGERTAALVLDRLDGYTSAGDSHAIVEALVGLPTPALVTALHRVMNPRESYGEAWDVGMLYWLFEDLTEDDRTRLAENLKTRHIFSDSSIDQLAAGRGWAGKYMPYTTHKAEEAAQYWADVSVNTEGPESWGAAFMGGMATLWTPQVATTTIITLGSAGFGEGVAAASPTAGRILGVAGVGLTAFQTTIAIEELATGENVWTGQPLGEGEALSRLLMAASNLLLLGAAVGGALRGPAPETPAPAPRLRWMVLRQGPGEWVAHGENLETGEQAVVRIDPLTGDGVAVNLSTGEMASIRNFELQRIAGMLGGGGAGAGAAAADVTPGEWLALPAEQTAEPVAPAAAPPPPTPQLLLGPGQGGTLGGYLSYQSLARIEARYGAAVRNATAAATSWADVDAIADTLGTRAREYKGLVGELGSADAALYEDFYVGSQHGSSNEPGPDVPTVSASGDPVIRLRESKVGTSETPYRIGRSGMPSVYRQGTTAVREYIWEIIRNESLPIAVRVRFKLALDEGNIQWQLDAYGNVRVKMSGTDQFPSDVTVTTPITLPLE